MTGFEPAASTSQTSRATNCATPRSVKNIEFLRFFRKWSNLWSNHLLCGFCERVECRKSQCLQGFSAFFASGYLGGGVLLPNQARYQLRYIPMFFFAILTGFGLAAARSPRGSNTPRRVIHLCSAVRQTLCVFLTTCDILVPNRLVYETSRIPTALHPDVYCERVYYSRFFEESQDLWQVFL